MGSVWALSTLGSLFGTFATTHLLVPTFGSQTTIVSSGIVLLLLGTCVAPYREKGSRALAGLACLLLGSAAYALDRAYPLRGTPPAEGEVIGRAESPYQFIRVVESKTREGLVQRWLQVNEGLDSFQSLQVEGRTFTDAYYDHLALSAYTLPASLETVRVLVIGLGGGTVVPILEELFEPLGVSLEIAGVEIDPAVVHFGKEHLGLDTAHVNLLTGVDGRVALRFLSGGWDLVLLDAYAAQVHIPPHLASVEFFDLVRSKLHPEHGILAANVGFVGADDPVPPAIANTMAKVFGKAWSWRVPRNRNKILLTRNGGTLSLDPVRTWSKRRLELVQDSAAKEELPFPKRLRQLMNELFFPGSVREVALDPHLELLTDDKPVLDMLQMEALTRRVGK